MRKLFARLYEIAVVIIVSILTLILYAWCLIAAAFITKFKVSKFVTEFDRQQEKMDKFADTLFEVIEEEA